MNRVICCVFLFWLVGCTSLPIIPEQEASSSTTAERREVESTTSRTPVPDNELTEERHILQGTDTTFTNCANRVHIGLVNHGMETWRVDGVPTELPTARMAVTPLNQDVIAVAGQSWEVEGCYFEVLEVVIGSTFHEGYVRLKVTPLDAP